MTIRAGLIRAAVFAQISATMAKRLSSLSGWRVWWAVTSFPFALWSRVGTRPAMARPSGAMPKPLLALNVVLVGISTLLFVSVVRALFAPDPLPTIHPHRPVEVAASPTRGRGPSTRPSSGYDLIAARNLFHPNRSESTRSGLVAQDVTPPTKPVLYGVVLSDDAGLAFLEDPATKRILGYRIGDDWAGGRVERIERDRVVISRAGGQVEVFLSGLHSPRQAETAAAPGEPNGSVAPMRRIPKD